MARTVTAADAPITPVDAAAAAVGVAAASASAPRAPQRVQLRPSPRPRMPRLGASAGGNPRLLSPPPLVAAPAPAAVPVAAAASASGGAARGRTGSAAPRRLSGRLLHGAVGCASPTVAARWVSRRRLSPPQPLPLLLLLVARHPLPFPRRREEHHARPAFLSCFPAVAPPRCRQASPLRLDHRTPWASDRLRHTGESQLSCPAGASGRTLALCCGGLRASRPSAAWAGGSRTRGRTQNTACARFSLRKQRAD